MTLEVWWMESVWGFHDGGPYYTETSPLICRTNQWTDFYTAGTSVMKELMLYYLHVFIEIYYWLWQNNWHTCIQISKEEAFN